MQFVAPAVAKASRLKNTVEERDDEEGDSIGGGIARTCSKKLFGEEEGPPLPLLLAGLMSPARLHLLVIWNRLQLILTVPVFLLLVGVMSFDIGRSCGSGSLWIWSLGMLALLGFTIIARLALLSKAVTALKELKHEGAASQLDIDSGGLIVDLKRRVMDNSSDFFCALVIYDRLVNSSASQCLNILNIAYIIWGAFGIGLSVWYIEADSTTCDALVLRFVAHAYSFLYVMLLSFTVPALFFWIFSAGLDNGGLEQHWRQASRQFDDSYTFGIPCASLLLRVFCLRNVMQIHEASLQDRESRVVDMMQHKSDLQEQVVSLDSELSCKEARLKKVLENQPQEDRDESMLTPEEAQAAAMNLALNALERAKMMGLDLQIIMQQVQEETSSRSHTASQEVARFVEEVGEEASHLTSEWQESAHGVISEARGTATASRVKE